MPSIEIVCVGQLHPTSFDSLPFAIEADTFLKSHRSPHPRFQSDFDQLSGILYHLGNPNLRNDREGRIFFAYELLGRKSREPYVTFLEFAEEYRPHIQVLLADLLRSSPAHRLVFTSDWQFGPEWTKHEGELTPEQFWHAHDSRRLLLNARYDVVDCKRQE